MADFVSKDSIVRRIWGKGDTILFIFAGASAEFALNKAVDWLYYTGRLPADPLGRLFSTVSYARLIVFSEYDEAVYAIDKITSIHKDVENKRGSEIPDWAYRDVLFMLIDYSIRSFEALERKLTQDEKTEIFDVFNRIGLRMGLKGLPDNYNDWLIMRSEHIQSNLSRSNFTGDLYKQYRRHLGWIRYQLLKQAQILVVPQIVNSMLSLGSIPLLDPVLKLYKLARIFKLEEYLKNTILPSEYKKQIADLDIKD
ncbi:oxygenase MpaB family protein [Pedobacter sp. P351]|uniref:oxygenase MpaB family protein n=1 Tax=Pedobacter superstes TaxID=3133441 RepID=UPI00309A59AD